jgi:ribosomal protein L16 Arg81 hydroxylase
LAIEKALTIQFPGLGADGSRAFAEEYWGRRPLYAPGAGPDAALQLTPECVYQSFIENLPTEAAFTCFHPSFEDPIERRQLLLQLWREGCPPSVEQIQAFNNTSALLIAAPQRFFSPLARLVTELSALLHCQFGCNLYMTKPKSHAFPAHVDQHHVLAVQLNGRKQWLVWRPRGAALCPGPYPGHADPPGEPLTWTTAPGDALYIPVGWIHRAKAVSDVSLHATLSIMLPRWRDWLHECLGEATCRQLIQISTLSLDEWEILGAEIPLGFSQAKGIGFFAKGPTAQSMVELVKRRLPTQLDRVRKRLNDEMRSVNIR